ncbi:hypothetical protein BD410DRAFT_791551 [Rickenella mellea]|uniref:GTP-binding protein n=1 Tax=Rickenella mellea TaxID=50990 RepID=A0A4Y7PZ69_9AGAM|nr:hypothetical protein BD410DRAFT_791551 [Rickenella mellea]
MEAFDDVVRTKILLYGLRRSGKTSIQQSLFNNLNPKQSFFVETTTRITKLNFDSIIPLEIWDCPGSISIEALGVPLSSFATIIFVIDIQDSYHQPIAKLIDVFVPAFQENPDVNLEVFVHKAEALSEDFRIDNFRHIQSRVADELADIPPMALTAPPSLSSGLPSPSSVSVTSREFVPYQIPLTFYLTSVHDHSLREAFSRVFQRLLAHSCLPYLEDLLNVFCANSHSSKAFLFDTQARVFVATDSSPVDTATHNLCCDYVLMLNSFGGLYKSAIASPTQHPRRTGSLPSSPSISTKTPPTYSARTSPSATAHAPLPPSTSASRSPTPTATISAAASPSHSLLSSISQSQSPQIVPKSMRTRKSSMETTSASSGGGAGNSNGIGNAGASPTPPTPPQSTSPPHGPAKVMFYPCSSTSLTPYTTLVYHNITSQLALLALIPTTVWENKRGLVEYNVVIFREGVQEICAVELDARRKRPPPPPLAPPKRKK